MSHQKTANQPTNSLTQHTVPLQSIIWMKKFQIFSFCSHDHLDLARICFYLIFIVLSFVSVKNILILFCVTLSTEKSLGVN